MQAPVERNNFVKLQMKRKMYKGRGANNHGTKPMGYSKGGSKVRTPTVGSWGGIVLLEGPRGALNPMSEVP